MGQEAEVRVFVPARNCDKRHKPMYVSPEVLNPTLCVSGVGVSTSKSFGAVSALVSPSKVHTSLVAMLVANDMTEDMICELLASGNAAPMMNTVLRSDPEGYNGGKQDTRGSNSIQVRNISLADAHHLEATVGPRTVRAKHLPPALQRRYGMGVAALQPSEVHSVRRVFEDVPARADSAPDAFSRMLQQRPGSHGASAAARIADVLSMAQAAVRKERQRAAATPAPILVRAGGARGAVRGRCASAASGRMRSVNVVSSRRAKSAGASQQQGIATSPFVTAGRDEAGKVGYNCLRTGLESGGDKGPACYEPRWRSLRPHSASAALGHGYESGGRHKGEAMSQAQKLKELALMDSPTSGLLATVAAEGSKSSNSSHSSACSHEHTAAARRFSGAGAAPGGVQMTPVHPKNPKVFQHERATNCSSFKAITRTAPAGGFAHAHDSMTSDSIGPGSYRSSMHRSGLSGRRVHSASSKPSRYACSPAWYAPQPQAYGLPQQRRNALSPGPGSYYLEVSGERPNCRGVDFTRGSPRPGSAPPLLPSQDSHIVPSVPTAEPHTTSNYCCGTTAVGEGDVSMPRIQRGRAGLHGVHVPSSCGNSHAHIINESQALGDTLEAEDFIYDDEEDAEEGDDASVDNCDSHGGVHGRSRKSTSPGKHRLLDAVDGARAAAEIHAALDEQQRQQLNRSNCKTPAEDGQVHKPEELESGRPLSALPSRPVSARPPSGRPKSALPPCSRPLSGRPLSGRPLSSQDGYRQRREGFRTQAGEMEESLMEDVEEEESCSDTESLPEPSIVSRSRGEHNAASKNNMPSTRVPTDATQEAEEALERSKHSRSRPVSAEGLSASLHTPWTYSDSPCSGLHSGWSAPSYQSSVELSSSCQLQQQLAASSNLRCTAGTLPVKGSANQVRRPSRSAHASRVPHSAVGVPSRMRPATACAGSSKRTCDIPSVATWSASRGHGGSPVVVERPVSAFSNPELAAEGMRLEREAVRRMHGRATAHPLSGCHPHATTAHPYRLQQGCQPTSASVKGAPGRLRKAREAQAATSANAFHGNMHGNQSSGSVSFKIDKKENQFSQANSTRNLKKHVTYNSGMGDSIGRGKGVLFSQSTRQQELSGQRFMGVSGIMKPVSAKPRVDANDAFYDSSVTAPSHRRRTSACVLPPCRYELQQRQQSQAKVSALDVQERINSLRMHTAS